MKKKIVIEGERVQDVGYRLYLLNVAEDFGLKGFQARNVGRDVEVLVEGDDEPVKAFLEEVRAKYPEHAEVKAVKVYDYEGNVINVEAFYRRLNLEQLIKIVNTGIGILERQDMMLEKQDKMLEKEDKMLEKQDMMLEKQDKMLEKQDMMLEKQDMMLKKQDMMLKKQDMMLEKQDKMLEKQDKMLEMQSLMLRKQDMMLEKQDVLIGEVRMLRGDLKSFIDERLSRI